MTGRRKRRVLDLAVAVLAGALGAQVMALGAEHPVPAPEGAPEQAISAELATLQAAVQDAERAAWDWRQFQRCTYQIHVAVHPGVPTPVVWKTSNKDCFR